MKRIFSVLVIFLFIFSLAACGSDIDRAKLSVSYEEETGPQSVPVTVSDAAEEENDMLNKETARAFRRMVCGRFILL